MSLSVLPSFFFPNRMNQLLIVDYITLLLAPSYQIACLDFLKLFYQILT